MPDASTAITTFATEMRGLADQVLQVITSPQFLDQVRLVKEAPPERRLQEASLRLTPKALRQVGVALPENFRISSRYFDDQAQSEVELADTEAGVNIVNALNEAKPGLLDELKVTKLDLFKRITQPDLMPIARSGSCVCGGFGGTCTGAGKLLV